MVIMIPEMVMMIAVVVLSDGDGGLMITMVTTRGVSHTLRLNNSHDHSSLLPEKHRPNHTMYDDAVQSLR